MLGSFPIVRGTGQDLCVVDKRRLGECLSGTNKDTSAGHFENELKFVAAAGALGLFAVRAGRQ